MDDLVQEAQFCLRKIIQIAGCFAPQHDERGPAEGRLPTSCCQGRLGAEVKMQGVTRRISLVSE